jgi:hypothetical protein
VTAVALGGLDDALERMARREALRQRTAGPRSPRPQAIDDLVESLRSLVRQHDALSLAVTAEHAGVTWHVRVAAAGEVEVTVPADGNGQTAARLADLLRRNPALDFRDE